MRAELFIDFAERLLRDDVVEAAALRSAVSRAYYTVYHMTKRLQESLGGRRVDSHSTVGDRFQTSPDPEISDLGERFLSLMTRRIHADYHLEGKYARDVEDLETVKGLLEDAKNLVSDIAAVSGGQLREAAQAAVRADDLRRFGR